MITYKSLMPVFSGPFLALIITFGFLLIIIAVRHKEFRSSSYQQVSGNGFLKTFLSDGTRGEYFTFLVIERIPGYKRILTNVYIPKSDGKTTEIDIVMINQQGVFVFENKHYSGWIFGNEKDYQWTQTFRSKKVRFYNPIKQNANHIKALAAELNLTTPNLFKSVVVFNNKSELKRVKYTPTSNLIVTKTFWLMSEYKSKGFPIILSKESVDYIYGVLKRYSNVNQEAKVQHIQSLRRR